MMFNQEKRVVPVTQEEIELCRREFALTVGKVGFDRMMQMLHLMRNGNLEVMPPAVTNRCPWNLLEPVSEVSVEGVDLFVAREKFRPTKDDEEGEVSIISLGPGFLERYLNKEEKNIQPGKLIVQQLKKKSLDGPVVTELGRFLETAMAHLWELLKRQGHGEEGALSVDGLANVLYAFDMYNNLGAVYASWVRGRKGWSIGTNSSERQIGSYIISPSPPLTAS